MHIHARTMQAGIVGASGYSGLELTKLLARHGAASIRFLTSDRWVGQTAGERAGLSGDAAALAYVGNAEGLALAKDCDVVFLATPAETSLELVPKLLALGVKVVDLAGSFRLKDASRYPPFYKFEHHAPALLAQAVYGLPELFRAEVTKSVQLVANPGCYPTAAALSLWPLLQRGLVDPSSIVINAASGVSGAGRKATEDYTFMELDADFRAYKVLGHQHTPEIEQTLSRAGAKVELVFTPHLLPMKRGILSTAVATLKAGVTQAAVSQAFADAYGDEPLVTVRTSPDAVRVADAALTPRCFLGAGTDGKRVVSIAAIDNLLKGAASQALQNANLLLGLPETEGVL